MEKCDMLCFKSVSRARNMSTISLKYIVPNVSTESLRLKKNPYFKPHLLNFRQFPIPTFSALWQMVQLHLLPHLIKVVGVETTGTIISLPRSSLTAFHSFSEFPLLSIPDSNQREIILEGQRNIHK